MALLVLAALLGLALLTALEQYLMEKVYEGANNANINAVPSLKILGELRRNLQEISTQAGRLDYGADMAERNRVEERLLVARDNVSNAIRAYETDGCAGTICFADEVDKADLEKEKPVWRQYQVILDKMLQEKGSSEQSVAKAHQFLLELDPVSDKMLKLIDEHIDYNIVIAKRFSDEADQAQRHCADLDHLRPDVAGHRRDRLLDDTVDFGATGGASRRKRPRSPPAWPRAIWPAISS
ncbi:hypothetical protein QR66_09270 [Chromobacterium piscinae]|nr:hypothetical protein QR66_09270 [Chromobacterium piscinae]